MNLSHMKILQYTCLFLFIFTIYSCGKQAEPDTKAQTLFELVTAKDSGIDFRNDLVEDIFSRNNVLSFEYYYHGGGVAIGDINNDGLNDVFFSGNVVNNKLFLNEGDMKFRDISISAGVNADKHWATGVNMVDINQDGWLDIYVCQAGPDPDPNKRQNLLYMNNKDLTFTQVAQNIGLNDPNLSIQSAFFDYDLDGDLDCFVLNESKYFRQNILLVLEDIKNKERLREASCKMFENRGGKFFDVTEEAGMLQYGYGLGVAVSDFNNDNYPDVYVVNDYSVPDFMYVNQGNGSFKDELKQRTKQISWFGMGIDIADINNDGHQEIAVVDMASKDHFRSKTLMAPMNTELFRFAVEEMQYQHQYMFNSLQLNLGNGQYSNIPFLTGVGKTEWSWASLLADFDNDGYRDYFVTNGSRRYYRDNDFRMKLREVREAHGGNVPNDLRQALWEEIPEIKLSNMVFRNDGNLQFEDISKTWGINHPGYSNGAAYGDLDNDGDLDLVVNNIDDYAHVYRNQASDMTQNHFLRIILKSSGPMVGTRVKLHYGPAQQIAEFSPVRGFQSSMEHALHFGLGDVKTVDKLEVTWPNGHVQILENIPSNETIELTQENAASKTTDEEITRPQLFTEAVSKETGIDFVHRENVYDDFIREVLLPYKQSTLGPFISKGDVNADGMEDFFIGGAKGQAGTLYLQHQNWFEKAASQPWARHAASEDMGSLFFDADGDGDQDLYVASGGNEFQSGSNLLQDRLYLNNGNGIFVNATDRLPEMISTTMKVAAYDFDGDGDQDLVVGGRHKPQQYPLPDRSYFLRNDAGKFIDMTEEIAPGQSQIGLVNDIQVTDLDNDGSDEIIFALEWNHIKVFSRQGEIFVDRSDKFGLAELHGWWFTVTPVDIDQDGDMDLIGGNLGLNSKFTASQDHPFLLYAGDFDENGTWDVVLSKEYKGRFVPTRGKECSSQQMPFIAEKFKTYRSFANASVDEILGETLESSLNLKTTEFRSMVLLNNGGTFTATPLPFPVQASAVYDIIPMDVNQDQKTDLVLAGNLYQMEIETPRLDASKGFVLLGDGKGQFEVMPHPASGLNAGGDVKDLEVLGMASSNQIILLAAQNNDQLLAFAMGQQKSAIN